MTRIVKHFARTVETEVTKMEEEMEDEDKDQHEDSRKLNEEVTLKEVSRAIQCQGARTGRGDRGDPESREKKDPESCVEALHFRLEHRDGAARLDARSRCSLI